ncbi:MAG TPA: TetR family transcriptional regulator C-terminal domain-containing protein [Sphingomicrobium sp.]|jgi:TetR/AcrR family transcriptional regulator
MEENKKRTRIQIRNEKLLLEAAEKIFASFGYHGATLEKVAAMADMSQPNLHHYFRTKLDLYTAVLAKTLDIWLAPLDSMDGEGDPEIELRRYIACKMELARVRPDASRIFTSEMLTGAPLIGTALQTRLKTTVDGSVRVIRRWVEEKKMIAVDPYHLLFMIWAATQHYSDFQPQIKSVMGKSRLTKADFAAAEESVSGIILRGVCLTADVI